jgi:hypothetical protein
MAMRASCTSLGIWGWEKSLSIRMPSINWVSSMLPPVFSWILMSSRFTSFLYRSATFSTAFTAISANLFLSLLTTFDPRDTQAASTKSAYSILENLISSLSSSSFLTAISTAISKPSDILRGCRPLSNSFSAYSNNAPASTTTPVVPSPTSLS